MNNENPFDKLIELTEKSVGVFSSQQKLQLALWVAEASLRFNKSPKEIVKVLKQAVKEIENFKEKKKRTD
jgi:DNA-binding IclR family transcriptional regulator